MIYNSAGSFFGFEIGVVFRRMNVGIMEYLLKLYPGRKSAGDADCIPAGSFATGDRIECVATPSDGILSGPSYTVRVVVPTR